MDIEQQIRLQAYEFWLAAGMREGDAERHWLQAELAVSRKPGVVVKAVKKPAIKAKPANVAKSATSTKPAKSAKPAAATKAAAPGRTRAAAARVGAEASA